MIAPLTCSGPDGSFFGVAGDSNHTGAPRQPSTLGHGSVCKDHCFVWYHPRVWLTTRTTSNITGTSINTPTTVAKAAPD